MNDIILKILIIIAFIIIILLGVVIYMIIKNHQLFPKNEKTKPTQNNQVKKPPIVKKEKKEEKVIAEPSLEGLFLPSIIENISEREISIIVKKIFDSYKVLDYKNKEENELENKEWHSWQVSILLMLYKYDEEFFIPNKEAVFHQFLIDASVSDIKSLMSTLIVKYMNNVDITKSKDELSKDYIWSSRDVSILFYFLSHYHNFDN